MTAHRVRDATPADVDAIRRVARTTWNAAYESILEQDTIDAALTEWYDPEVLRERVGSEKTVFLVAEADGEAVGYANGGREAVGEDVREAAGEDVREAAGEDVREAAGEDVRDDGGADNGDDAELNGPPVHLGAIYVLPKHWGEGVGSILFDAFEDWCRTREYPGIVVQVLAGNERAIDFYRRHGFERVAEQDVTVFGETTRDVRLRKTLA